MPRSRRKSSFRGFAGLLLFIIALTGGALYWWDGLGADHQRLYVLTGMAGAAGLAALLLGWSVYRRRRRREIWRRAVASWEQSTRSGRAIEYASARQFSPAQLEKFSAQLFRKMGYRVVHTGQSGDHGVDVHLVNPQGGVELVQCKQWQKPVGEPEVRDLAGAMLHEGAARGFILAPGGFSASARKWAAGHEIVLADEAEIGRLVESAYGKPKASRI